MNGNESAFILSISFQLAGALILLIFNFSSKKEAVFKEFYSQHRGVIKVKNVEGKPKVDKKEVNAVLTQIYVNRGAFIYLICGYALNIWASNVENKLIAVILICALCILLILVACIIAKFLPMLKKEKFYEIGKTIPPEGVTFMEEYK